MLDPLEIVLYAVGVVALISIIIGAEDMAAALPPSPRCPL
jgi:hypothetical protein